MPAGQQNGFDAERFAAFVATFDNNPNEAESMTGARMFRRMAKAEGLRVVDLFYRGDVMTALDAVLQPVRENPDKAAREAAENEAAELRAKLAGAIAKATDLANELTNEKELTARLRGHNPAGAAKQGQGNPEPDATAGGWLAALVALAAAITMIASAFR
jgi:hypothetical protein